MFHYTISNPPYQLDSNNQHNTATSNIYHLFYQYGIQTSSDTIMIFPAGRWMQKTDRGLQAANIITPNVESIDYYANDTSSKVFPTVHIDDGVAIVSSSSNISDTVLLNGYHYDRPSEESILPLTPYGVQLVRKIRNKLGSYPSISSRKFSNNFGLRTYYVERNKDRVCQNVPSVMSDYVEAWLANDAKGVEKRVEHYYLLKDEVTWTSPRVKVYESFKVCASKESGKRPDRSNYIVVDRNTVVGESWTIYGYFPTRREAENYKKYLDVPIVKTLLAESKGGKNKTWGHFVPDLGDYSDSNPHIDWDATLDEQICDMFNLLDCKLT